MFLLVDGVTKGTKPPRGSPHRLLVEPFLPITQRRRKSCSPSIGSFVTQRSSFVLERHQIQSAECSSFRGQPLSCYPSDLPEKQVALERSAERSASPLLCFPLNSKKKDLICVLVLILKTLGFFELLDNSWPNYILPRPGLTSIFWSLSLLTSLFNPQLHTGNMLLLLIRPLTECPQPASPFDFPHLYLWWRTDDLCWRRQSFGFICFPFSWI